MVDRSSNTSTATFHGARDEKAKTMKQKREKMKTQEEKEEADKNFDMLTETFQLSMRSKGEEDKDSSSKKKCEVGSSKKTAESKQHAVAKICAAAKQ